MRTLDSLIRAAVAGIVVTIVPAANVVAAGQPTTSDAHGFFSKIFDAGGVKYESHHDSFTLLKVTGYSNSDECHSVVTYDGDDDSSGQLSIDWSNITSVITANDGYDFALRGAIDFEIGSNSGTFSYTEFRASDTTTATRLLHAAQLLSQHCGNGTGSKFD